MLGLKEVCTLCFEIKSFLYFFFHFIYFFLIFNLIILKHVFPKTCVPSKQRVQKRKYMNHKYKHKTVFISVHVNTMYICMNTSLFITEMQIKTMRYNFSPTRMAIYSDNDKYQVLAVRWSSYNLCTLLVGGKMVQPLW